ncbi:uncharacterized protein N0V89_007993 [Didymosphaeria variabile]|uniref:Bud22 domain-containing protein n=1 Tax=Didymosphaeria variabile TaxID=1932322 RepID=A0A9W8XFK5_9PLEO|nr:uncharacterized protein N0V89_007993 [Didymosphaeria variabile]KAJ4349378.1 hypothetical protein N0V89_007993 [Didymosphaeria variabile]
MPKRKRTEPTGPDPPEHIAHRILARRKKQCTQRIAAAQKPLVAALRVAAGLERQKHSRRKKTAQANKDDKASARLEAEYAHLKGLDLEKVAEQHLRKTIGKVKSLRESEYMPESVGEVEKGSNDPALLNVKGRLFKVDAVRRVVDETIDELKEIVGVGANGAKAEGKKEEDKAAKSKKAKIQEEEEEEDEDEDEDEDAWAQSALAQNEEDGRLLAAFDALIAAPSSAEDSSEDSLSDGHRPPSEEDMASEDEDEDEDALAQSAQAQFEEDRRLLADFDALIAASSSAEDDNEGTESGLVSDVTENQDSDSASDSDEPSIPLPKAKRKAADPKISADSKFLPTLSHPTYISGSESEASDIEVAPRKNRRGQKARQKIWEQKYKDKAKHVIKQERDQGWDAKRGAVGERGGRNGRGAPVRGRGPEVSGANEQPLGVKKPKRDDAGSLHPSWQAAKAAKEKKMDMKPMGKKVVFD